MFKTYIIWSNKNNEHSLKYQISTTFGCEDSDYKIRALGNDIQRHLLVVKLTMHLGGWGNWCYAHQYDTNPRKGRKTGRART